MAECSDCGAYMNPAEAMMGPTCGKCVRAYHLYVTTSGRQGRAPR